MFFEKTKKRLQRRHLAPHRFSYPMSSAFLVASILAIGWNVTVAALVVFAGATPFEEEADTSRSVHYCLRDVRAEVGTLEYSAQSGGAGERVDPAVLTNRARPDVEKTSCEVEVEVPYADASVAVMTEEREEQRHCSVCMN